MAELRRNFIHGEWVAGSGAGTPIFAPVTGEELGALPMAC